MRRALNRTVEAPRLLCLPRDTNKIFGILPETCASIGVVLQLHSNVALGNGSDDPGHFSMASFLGIAGVAFLFLSLNASP